MEVKVANRIYRMNREKYKSFLEIAKEQVPFGIYAVEKNGYAELQNLRCKSVTELKNLTRGFKQKGYKVFSNGR